MYDDDDYLIICFNFILLQKQYHVAKVSVTNRSANIAAVVARLEQDLQLLCLTGVEDALQVCVLFT
jgi:hypothetical protein